MGFNFRTFRLLTRVRDLLRLPQTHTRTRARPRGRTPVRVTWPLLRVVLDEYVYLGHALEHLRKGLTQEWVSILEHLGC